MLKEIEHVKVDYNKQRYAGHPRQGGIFAFGKEEIIVLYNRASCAYEKQSDINHDFGGYHGRSQVVLARSLDGGSNWDRANDVIVFDQTKTETQRLAFIKQADDDPRIERDQIDLNALDSAIFFGRTWIADTYPARMLVFSVRSANRGHTWESVPTPIHPPDVPDKGTRSILKDDHPIVAMPDGTHLGAMSGPGGIWLYGSDNDGCSWQPLAIICSDPTGLGRCTYAGLVLLPSGRLQCYNLNIGGLRDAIQMCYSDDGGYSWSVPVPIVRWGGDSPWAARAKTILAHEGGAFGKFYRSPWPMRLEDGRIVVLFGRRRPPFGMGVIVSEDEGESWSAEQILRDDASGPDLAYPVAVELKPGKIFAAYYFMENDGNNFGGTRFIAGTHFRL